tara:strand:- start:919 stop:1152 length:234 start_codon:yes stop_codon:yes gene_type:complete
MSEWKRIEYFHDDGRLHVRGLFVIKTSVNPTDKYFDAYVGYVDDETKEFKLINGDDCGWDVDDFTHFHEISPEPPND